MKKTIFVLVHESKDEQEESAVKNDIDMLMQNYDHKLYLDDIFDVPEENK